MKFNTANPFFYEKDIKEILSITERMLKGDSLLSMGDYVREFESLFSTYIDCEFSVATNSCTTAMETALSAMDISRDDEVIVPAQTFIATGSSVARLGATPIFCEVNNNFLLDTNDMKKKITSSTKAVILVHYAGLIHDEIFKLKEYLNNRGIYLIEDAAHAPGASIDGLKAGNIGDVGCFSFFSTKNITTGEGGMITSNNKKLIDKCSSIRNRGLDLSSELETFNLIGSNHRMTEFQALLGIHQLKRLDEFNRHRNQIAKKYNEILEPFISNGKIVLPNSDDNIFHTYWRYWARLSNPNIRKKIQKKMHELSIQVDWAYWPLVHLQPVFKRLYNNQEGMLPKSEKLAASHICLPIHFKISLEDAKYIGQCFATCLNEVD